MLVFGVKSHRIFVKSVSCIPLICLFFGLNGLYAQVTGNEWIDYDSPYWRFKIAQNGYFSLSHSQLQTAGFPVDAISPADIQLMAREQEVHLEFTGSNPEVFQPGDELRFKSKRNDGWLDALVYDEETNQANEAYSLFNDTAMYFLTYNQSSHLRTAYFSEDNYGDYLPLPYIFTRSRKEYTTNYLFGVQDQNGISLPYYQEGEGWFDAVFGMGSLVNKDIPTPNSYNGVDAPPGVVYATSASASMASGLYNHHLQVGYGINFTLAIDTIFQDYQLNKLSFSIPANQLGALNTRVTHRSINDLGVASDFQAVSAVEILYAHITVVDDDELFYFEVKNLFGQEKAYVQLDISGMNDARLFIDALDFPMEIGFTQVEDIIHFIVPFEGAESIKLCLLSQSELTPAPVPVPVSSSGFFAKYSVQQLDSAFLIITHPMLLPSATNYGAYRQLQGMDVLLVNVEELYMQYAAGIWKHPIAIRRFCNHLLEEWPSDPSHLFLAGKSIHEMKISGSLGARNNTSDYARNLVPTWGFPSSDLAITSGLGDTFLETAIPTGRIAAESNEQLLEYLNKVVEHEAHTPKMWQKNILHFGGGGNDSEQQLFAYFLSLYKNISQDTCLGGKVFTFLKDTTDPVQINLSDSIQTLIDEGVMLMTFFGHASSTGFDQNIDAPENYNNQGKYPLLIGNSCYTGNIHLSPSQSASENFVLVPNRGVIGFIAKSDLGQPNYLNEFTLNFYKELFQKKYGSSIGQCMKYAVQDFQGSNPEPSRINTALTFSLHGDPSIRMFPSERTDYVVDINDIVFEPTEVSAQLDSFVVKVAVSNPAKATNRAVGIELIRHYPNGVDSSYSVTLPNVLYRDTAYFTLPIDPINGVGLNQFDVLVDYPFDFIDELDDVGNNIVFNRTLLITSGDLIPAWPFDFAVVPNSTVSLQASTAYVLEPDKLYLFQVDTTDTFDSPWLQAFETNQSGGVVEWTLPFQLEEARVYYWRCAANNNNPDDTKWRESSFQYLNGQEGWGQAHIFQIENNSLNNLDFDRDNRRLNYSIGDISMKCEVYGNPQSSYEALGTRYQLDLDVQDYSGCGNTPALMVAVIDSVSLQPWETNFDGANPQNDFGNQMACSYSRNRTEKYFIFRQNNAQELQGFEDMITNHIPDGAYLLIYSWVYANYDGWEQNYPGVFDVFQNLGSSQIGVAQDSVPFIFFTKMGHPETTQELYGTFDNEYLVMEQYLTGTSGLGKMTTPLIGPSLAWENVLWSGVEANENAGDSTQTSALGITNSGLEIPLFQNGDLSGSEDISALAPVQFYPFLKLSKELTDAQNLTAPIFKSWHVLYETAPEVALNPQEGLLLPSDTVQEGEIISFAMAIENISNKAMDSLLVSYWIEDDSGIPHFLAYPVQAPLLSGEILLDTISISTVGKIGLNHIWIEVNPFNAITGLTDQPEQHHFNNIASFPLRVLSDQINPVLDVTFDGIHILNGDIVSAAPEIAILLEDENPWFLLNEAADTSLFKVFLNGPDMDERLLRFSDELLFEPAINQNNRSMVLYRPQFMKDGVYRLRVQARDKSGNASGKIDYQISFEVITRPGITEVLNYPNPFSTNTRFVFTITGTEVPDEMKIQIMTVGGRVVREILGYELGSLHVGRNLTEYRWNGTDEYGDRLANGVYLYRVVARLNGEDLEMRSTEVSEFFNRGFGKMVLMR